MYPIKRYPPHTCCTRWALALKHWCRSGAVFLQTQSLEETAGARCSPNGMTASTVWRQRQAGVQFLIHVSYFAAWFVNTPEPTVPHSVSHESS